MSLACLIISQRDRSDGFGRQPGYVAFIEAEDILARHSSADMAMVDLGPRHPRIRARRLGGRAVRRVTNSSDPLPTALSTRSTATLPRDHYDVAIFVGFTIWELPMLERMAEVRKHADHVVAWFPEVWAGELDDQRISHESFGMLDTIFVGMEAATERLAELVSCPVHHLPLAVDVARFATMTPHKPRPIDVLGIGRRDPELHQALLDWSRKANKLYIYDTISGSSVPDPDAHRGNLSDMYLRSNVAITNFAKWDLPAVVNDERELPGRIWEGLASGVYMIGRAPSIHLQEQVVGRKVVAALPESPGEAVESIDAAISTDQEPLRRANVQLALRNHDWAHRWSTVFERCGLVTPSGLQGRIEQLAGQADSLD
ncbi:MAG: hypothetical protein GY724_08405 [Actinomycetia bacterium]|nr:hypothetical protein [Actinomycetes bacterium]